MMTRKIKRFWLVWLLIIPAYQISAQSLTEKNNLFDFGWRFYLGGAQGAENPSFDDSNWRKIDLPHDWSIEDLPGTDSPFSINAISQVSGGFTTGGTGWYRKSFSLPENLKTKRFRILFEGVYMNCEVYLNGQYIGSNPYGYTSFWFDISDKLNPGEENVLSVKVRNEGENSRWYSGSGLYRHVWLQVLSPVHTDTWGIFITTPQVSENEAMVNIKTTLVNESNETSSIKIITRILDKNSLEISKSEALKTIEAGKNNILDQNIKLMNPLLWSPDSPELYRAVSEIYENDLLVDQTTTIFGVRTISFDTLNGFLLNGKPLKLKGGCVHHDNGPLGSRAYDRAEERRVELLKASGFNAIRCAHNPPSAAFLDACDRLGMLVMDEAFDMWNEQKNPNDYHLYFNDWWKKDIESMVFRDRNHPSVILWSIGNEIPGRQRSEVAELAGEISKFVKSIDSTRPVTSAVNDLKPDKDPYFAALDVAGYNYASGGDPGQRGIYKDDHSRVPGRIMVGTESFPLEAFASWMDVRDNVYVIGDFVWTSFDYIGEASIGWRGYWQKQDFFPWNLAYCGDIDICGWKRAQSYYRDVLWNENQLSIWITPPEPSFELNPERQTWSKWHWFDAVDDWNWSNDESKTVEVNVYSSCEQVELFLNGKSLGKKPTNRSTKYIAIWQLPFQPGILKAIGYKGKKQVCISELKTAGEPSLIKIAADRTEITANGQDLCYAVVELTDTNGIRNPKAENLISFTLDGPGTILAVGNANPVSLESYQLPHRKAWRGRCLVIVKSETKGGIITLKASSAGLVPASIEIRSN
jgi:beta-galactosidase